MSPVPEIPTEIYGEDYFFGSTNGFGYVDYDSDKQAMVGELRRTCMELEERLGRKGTLLDVGAATGYFVELAGGEGWRAEGVELSAAAVRYGKEKGRALTTGTITSLHGSERFDAVTFLDVLEHVPDPKGALMDAHRLLNRDGVVLINVPDFGSVFARIMGRNWQAVIPPEHLWFFTRKSLRLALEKAGFTDICFRKPLKTFRVRYIVSVLSRKFSWRLLRWMYPLIERSAIGRIKLPVPVFDNLLVTAKKSSESSERVKVRPRNFHYVLALCAVVLVLFLTPIFRVRSIAGVEWRGVVPSVVDDDVYYYARLHEIQDGQPLIGNPYFYEHRNDPSPAFIGADWVASVPFFFLPFAYGVMWNLLFWPMLLALLAYRLFQNVGVRGWWAVAGSLAVILVSYGVLIRPTSMQVVLPSLLLFWLALHAWIRLPFSRSTSAWLAGATALQFYIYSYLWLAAGGTYLAYLAVQSARRKWSEAVRCITIGIASLILAGPALWLTLIQMQNPWHWETMQRIGLIQTHIPPFLAFELTLWIACICLLWRLLIRFRGAEASRALFILTSGLGIAVVMLSPILSGKELATPNHLLRFAIPWGVLALVVIVAGNSQWRGISVVRKVVSFFLFLVALYFPLSVFWAIPRYFWMTTSQTHDDIRYVQAYAGPAAWLNANADRADVVLADPRFSTHIPILTRQYVLFESFGTLHLLSTREAEDRFLAAQAFHPPTVDSLLSQYRSFAGTGNAIDLPNTLTREAKLCRSVRVIKSCGAPITSIADWRGRGYFEDLVHRFQTEVAPDIVGALRRFNVTYIVKDMAANAEWDVAGLPSAKKVYTDSRFEIYKISQ